MTPSLILRNNSASNPQTIDLSQYLRLQPDQGTDPANPESTQRVFARSLLKEGATLALEQNVEREWQFPLALKGTTSSVVSGTLVQQINQILQTPGATGSWQDAGMSQPTYFDVLSGQVAVQYDYFVGAQAWCKVNLMIFTLPFGRTIGPRAYARASAAGPLLMISPYAVNGSPIGGASTQAGIAGFGCAPLGGSSGVFWLGSPSLAGDAPSLLLVSATGNAGTLASAAVLSVLPDGNYPVSPGLTGFGAITYTYGASVIGGFAYGAGVGSTQGTLQFTTQPLNPTVLAYPGNWAGQHRLFAVARASGTWGQLRTAASQVVDRPTVASVGPPGTEWGLYDLGAITIRGSQSGFTGGYLDLLVPSVAGVGANAALDVSTIYMFPESTTCFSGASAIANAPAADNTFLFDDTLAEQFVEVSSSGHPASPAGLRGWNVGLTRITPYTRGLVPKPDPKNGIPIIAILQAGASSLNPGVLSQAQVAVLERARYIMP